MCGFAKPFRYTTPGGPSPCPGDYPGAFGCRVGGGRAGMPCLRPLAQTARAVFPQAAFLRCSSLEASMDETGNEMGQSPQAMLPDQPPGGVPAPHPIAPAFRQKRMDAVLDPAVEPMEEPSHIRLAIEV